MASSAILVDFNGRFKKAISSKDNPDFLWRTPRRGSPQKIEQVLSGEKPKS
jgi:hypothetical protein